MLSIPSYKTDDPNYRYKMPRLVAKVEGRGNGIKTNIVNMGDIARALKRPPDYPTKFCGTELGAQSKFDIAEGKAIVNGAHEQRDLQGLIDKFIEKFVLCANCRLPEIDLVVKKGRVQYSCNACGHKGEVDNAHKLATFILKNPPGGSDSTMGSKKKKGSADAKEGKEGRTRSKAAEISDESESDDELEGDKVNKRKKQPKSSKGDKDKSPDSKSKSKSSKSKGREGSSADAKEKKGDQDSLSSDVASDTKQTTDENEKKVKKNHRKSKKDNAGSDNVEELDNLMYNSPEVLDVINRMMSMLRGDSSTTQESSDVKAEIEQSVTSEVFFEQLRVLQMAQGFDHVIKFYVALESLFASELRGLTASTLEQRIRYLKVGAHTRAPDILMALQDFIFLRGGSDVVPEGFKAYAAILYSFYDNDILLGDEILKFYLTDSHKKGRSELHELSGEAFDAAKEAAKPFLAWLKESDDEDDEDVQSDDKTNLDGAVLTKSIGTIETPSVVSDNKTLPSTTYAKKLDVDGNDSDIDIDAL